MEIRIAASLVDTLKYRLYAQATMPAGGQVEIDVVPVTGACDAPSVAAQRSGDPPPALIATVLLKPADVSAAIRALRERTYREVQSQIAHFCRTTGREWQIRALHYGELLPQPEVDDDTHTVTTRLTLVTDVELGASVPILH